MTVPHDSAKTVEFLADYRPKGPWVLTSIVPDGKATTATFTDADKAAAWIEKRQGKENLYFHVNPTFKPVTKKAQKLEMSHFEYLHVDLDPRPNEDVDAERERNAALLGEFDPPPTFIINSGNGLQAFWRLAEPVELDGTLDVAREVERYNRKVQIDLEADTCHDISRLMRLPATVNLPNKKKRSKGYEPCPTSVIEQDLGRVYELDRFAQAEELEPETKRDGGAHEPSGARGRNERGHPLVPAPTSPKLKTYLRDCHDDDKRPKKYKSGSHWQWAGFQAMAREGWDQEQIAAAGADDAHVQRQPNPANYAWGQAGKAIDTVANDEISLINRDYFGAIEGGKLRFYREEDDDTLTRMDQTAFTFAVGHLRTVIKTDKGDVIAKSVKLWLESPRRRFYPRGFLVDPSGSCHHDWYNLWKGFTVEPAPGDWPLMRAHIEDVLAYGNAEYTDYILKWVAWTFQNPVVPPRVALVFQGGQGVGKGIFANAILKVFGSHGMAVGSQKQVSGDFNAHLHNRCFLFADEAQLLDLKSIGALNRLISEREVPIERKGIDVFQADNYLSVIMASNSDWIIPAGPDARRFAVFRVSEHQQGNTEYFSALAAEMAGPGLAAMVYDLLQMDLGDWHPEAARPTTAALTEQKVLSLFGAARAVYELLAVPDSSVIAKVDRDRAFVVTRFLHELALRNRIDCSPSAVGRALGKLSSGPGMRAPGVPGQPRGYWLPPLGECRRLFGEEYVWPDGNNEWPGVEIKGETDEIPF